MLEAGRAAGNRSISLGRLLPRSTEGWLIVVIALLAGFLGLATDTFLTLPNLFDLLNISAFNVILAVGLLVVLVAGGIDISFAVAASVVQYLVAITVMQLGGGNWAIGIILAMTFGFMLGSINAGLIYYFRIISIVVTIATFNVFFGLLMFFTRGRSIYNLPDWWLDRIIIFEVETQRGFAFLTLPVVVMVATVLATWFLLRRTSLGRQLYAMGDNPDGARRVGINIAAMHFLAYGWLGVCAGIGGLMQAHYVQEVVPNALYGRELDVLAAVVLGGARLGGGRGTILGTLLGVTLVTMTANGLNLLGVSPYAFKMVVGLVILVAITTSNIKGLEQLFERFRRMRAARLVGGGS
jgi:simple sugar transport system permease protein